MNKLVEKINKYIIDTKGSGEDLIEPGLSTYSISEKIMEYAHRNQTRENGEPYANHPARVEGMYRDLIGNSGCCPYVEPFTLELFNIPFEGVQEVCLLHDVVEDTELTIEDLHNVFINCEEGDYFDRFLKKPLECITHKKETGYSDYIFECLKDPTAALVKMIDLQDNLFVLGLVSFDDKKYTRAQDYLHWIFVINEEYHFIENIEKYKKETKGY